MRFSYFYLLLLSVILIPQTSFTASAFRLPNIFPNASAIPPSLRPNSTAWEPFKKLAGCRPGQKLEGLSKLKTYFQYFGYINNVSASNFTDDFDDALEAAIRKYQLNYNLNQTGQLDDATLQQIILPRCGNADIVNGTSKMNSGKSNTTTLNHVHTVAHYTFFDNMPRWPSSKRDLTYAFLIDNNLSDAAKAVFSRAFDKWAAVIPMTFTMTDSYSTADIKIGFYSGDHGDGEPFDGVLGTLAHAFSPTSGKFHLDDAETWVIDGDVTQSSDSTAIDLESVAVHEIGHLLGLGHSSEIEAIMYPTISSGTRKVDLATDDVDGVQVLYGSNPNYNASATTTSQQSEKNWGWIVGPSWLLSLAVGFVVVALV